MKNLVSVIELSLGATSAMTGDGIFLARAQIWGRDVAIGRRGRRRGAT